MKSQLKIPGIFFLLILQGLTLKGQGLLNNGTNLVTNGTVSVVINNGGFTNAGVFTKSTSTLSFTGNTATVNSFIGGSSATSFFNLTLNKTSNGLQLNRNISVSNNLGLLGGDSIFLNNYIIDLGSAGSITGETNSSRITGRTGGYIQKQTVLNAPVAVNPGNIGLTITSAANLGNTIIKRGHLQQGGNSIYRYYDVQPDNNAGLNAQLQFAYFHDELGLLTEANLVQYTSADNGAMWYFSGKSNADENANYVAMTGYNSLGRVTLGDVYIALPVKQVTLSYMAKGSSVLLKWKAITDVPIDFFEVERADDDKKYESIGRVNGNGMAAMDYYFTDNEGSLAEYYYRVKAVGTDHSLVWSNTVKSAVSFLFTAPIRTFPNPAKDYIRLYINSSKSLTTQLNMSDAFGKIIMQVPVSLTKGNNVIPLNVSVLSKGIYYVWAPALESTPVEVIRY